MLSPYSPFYNAHCIRCRLPEPACVCEKLIQTGLPFTIMLCSHSKEWQRNDNTGQWAVLSSPNIKRYRWHRKPELISPRLTMPSSQPEPGHFLLFPGDNSLPITPSMQTFTHLWVIDGTWQEAQKMLNQSPWLKSLPQVSITSATSKFVLRRNQQGLSTMEAIEWAIREGFPNDHSANILMNNFNLLQNQLVNLLR